MSLYSFPASWTHCIIQHINHSTSFTTNKQTQKQNLSKTVPETKIFSMRTPNMIYKLIKEDMNIVL